METPSLLPSINVEALPHRGEVRIGLHFPYQKDLMTNGTAIRYIQEALGHKSIRTTEVYTHVAKDRKQTPPLDTLEI